MTCSTTHHLACDCREDRINELLSAAFDLARAYHRISRGVTNDTVDGIAHDAMTRIQRLTTGGGYFVAALDREKPEA